MLVQIKSTVLNFWGGFKLEYSTSKADLQHLHFQENMIIFFLSKLVGNYIYTS